MVKFSKQLELQLVPEWRSAFCDYWKLKKHLKLVKHHLTPSPPPPPPPLHPRRKPRPLPTSRRKSLSSPPPVIEVHSHKAPIQGSLKIYETQVLEPLCNIEGETIFFKALDEELNKVNSFYASKEDENLKRMESLKHQLTNFIGFKKTLEDQRPPSLSHSLVSASMGLFLFPQKSSTSIPKKCTCLSLTSLYVVINK
ncbi:hypothetical protein L7F22_045763 [Adiantum nelumboides]|nr:hypothetical protein [Adiantum nelumboides]